VGWAPFEETAAKVFDDGDNRVVVVVTALRLAWYVLVLQKPHLDAVVIYGSSRATLPCPVIDQTHMLTRAIRMLRHGH
jgi:hypothetical protein